MTELLPAEASGVRRQRIKLQPWIRSRLWAQVLVGMILGLAVGAALGPDTAVVDIRTAEVLGAWLALPGKLFLGLIAMVLVPLVFASIVGGLAGASSAGDLRYIGLRFAAFVVGTTLLAAWLGVALAQWIRPGDGFSDTALAGAAPQVTIAPFDAAAAPEMIAGLLPANPIASIGSGDMLAVVILAVLVGLASTQVERARITPFLALLDALLSIAMTIVKWAMFLAPFAVFGLIAQLVMRVGLETIVGLSNYVATVLIGLILLFLVYIAVVSIWVNPVRFMKIAGSNLLLAFSTSSSAAVMPMTIQTARRLGVPESVASLVVPLGATMNMAGTALYQSVAILFLAQLAGIELATSQIVAVTLTLVASSIGAPGTPGVSIAILIAVATGFGIPVEGMVLILGVDRLLDMSRTTANVTGDLVASVALRRSAPPHVASTSPHSPTPGEQPS